jgi:hypothetical protein
MQNLPLAELVKHRKTEKDVEGRLKREGRVVVNSIDDIITVIKKCMNTPDAKEINLSANIQWKDNDTNESGTDTANSVSKDITLKQMLLDGLDHVKKYTEAINKAKTKLLEVDDEVPDLWNSTTFNVDRLIDRRMGGKRNGLRVRWEIQDGIYEFDPYINKLYKINE